MKFSELNSMPWISETAKLKRRSNYGKPGRSSQKLLSNTTWMKLECSQTIWLTKWSSNCLQLTLDWEKTWDFTNKESIEELTLKKRDSLPWKRKGKMRRKPSRRMELENRFGLMSWITLILKESRIWNLKRALTTIGLGGRRETGKTSPTFLNEG